MLTYVNISRTNLVDLKLTLQIKHLTGILIYAVQRRNNRVRQTPQLGNHGYYI